jgi:2-deoxy-D-gluconate 3-dehydrogenase
VSGPLSGRAAIVTGAGRGIGRAVALALAEAGADLALTGRTPEPLQDAAEQASAAGVRAVAVPADVTDDGSVQRMVAQAVDALGRVDILVNNSGILLESPFLEQPQEDFDRIVATNLRGTALCCRAVGAHLVEQGSGRVVNVASNLGIGAVANLAAYCASKAAVLGLTRALSLEWARHGVQVNAVAPGYVETDMNAALRADEKLSATVMRRIPARRMAHADEVGAAVVFLAGPGAGYVTGETLVVDGGQLAQA